MGRLRGCNIYLRVDWWGSEVKYGGKALLVFVGSQLMYGGGGCLESGAFAQNWWRHLNRWRHLYLKSTFGKVMRDFMG